MDMMEYNTKVIDAIFGNVICPVPEGRFYTKKLSPEQIIYSAYQNGMTNVAEDGECVADLIKCMGEFSKYEVLTETDSDAIFKSLDRALRDQSDANCLAFAHLMLDEVKKYVAKVFESAEDGVRNDSAWRP